MGRKSEDLLESKRELKAETIDYIGNVSMPYAHYHEHYEILYVRENSRILAVNDEEYMLNEGSIALIKPFLMHKTESDENKKQKRSLVNFSVEVGEEIERFLKSNILSCFDSPVLEIGKETGKRIRESMDRLSSLKDEDEMFEAKFKAELLDMIIIIAGEMVTQEDKRTGGKVVDIIPQVAKRIQQHLGDEITLNGLSEEFGISPCYLSRCFKANMGMSLTKFINNARIVEAQRLIKDGYTSVTAVAMGVGFSNITHFERVFKETVGISPKKYMKMIL